MKLPLHISTLACLTLTIISCSQQHDIEGYIKGIGSDTILVEYAPIDEFYTLDEPFRDTIISKNGRFYYDSPVGEAIMLFMYPQKGSFQRYYGYRYHPSQTRLDMFLLPDDQIMVNGELHEYHLDYNLKGSLLNEQLSSLRIQYNAKTAEAVAIELQIDSLEFYNGDKETISRLYQKRNEINQRARAAQVEFAKAHPDQDISAFYLTRQHLDTLGKYHRRLSSEVRNGIFQLMLEERYIKYQKFTKVQKAVKQVRQGAVAPAFTLNSLNGDDLSLQDVKAEYVVLDFWGSWCGPCIIGFPKMKEYYQKYNRKVEFVGVACNDEETKWKKTVEKHSLPWPQVINESALDQDVSVRYGVMNYPTKFIIDQDRIVIAKFEGESDDFYQKLDELLAN